jgi:hypothetical protein
MDIQTNKGKKRKQQGKRKFSCITVNFTVSSHIIDNALDISTSHTFVAPYEICDNALGFCQALVSGYLFEHRSFTSLYEQR